jgi:hypothetical protein
MNSLRSLAIALVLVLVASLATSAARAQQEPCFRPPAVPLVAHTPYFSIWSPTNRLTDGDTVHWTGHPQPLAGFVRIDGKLCRVLGNQPRAIPALEQTAFRMTPTRSTYTFGGAGVTVTLSFTSPLLFDDLDLLARPVTYVTWEVAAADDKPHAVEVMLAADGAIAVDNDKQSVAIKAEPVEGVAAVRVGTPEQPVVETRGDDRRIDWGYGYVAAPSKNATTGAGPMAELVASFAKSGQLPGAADVAPHAVGEGRPSIAVAVSLGSAAKASATTLLAYDEVGSVLYFGKTLQPYWKRGGATIADALQAALQDQADVLRRCDAFDKELTDDATRIGGPRYAALCTLAYRQAIAANGLAADASGAPLFFPKENHSNGCISTVDVLYPQIPQLLLMSPTLAKAILVPPADYAASPAWKYPYAPHDLGQYPHATGQVYGMGGPDANRMPVEECGNMILSIAAVAHLDGDAKFAGRWWPQLQSWENYLEQQGFDPGNQLCTDDFAGHLAHNANLSIKSIEAIAAFGKLCGLRGDKAGQEKYLAMARDFAQKWMAAADDGEKYRLAFDQPGSWSQKYNLAWDRILDLNVFPTEVAEKEMAWYRQALNPYGLPLDSRKTYTKSDWTIWSATLRGGKREDIDLLSSRLLDAFNEIPQRRAMTDWYETLEPKKVGFTGRSVVGGYFMPFLTDKALWTKYASRDKANPKSPDAWAAMPVPQPPKIIVPLSADAHEVWRYTTQQPAKAWAEPAFDDKSWKEGKAGFGTPNTPGANLGTTWNTADIWLRRTFTLPADAHGPIVPYVIHDEDTEIYVDGLLASKLPGFITEPQVVSRVRDAAAALLKPGATVTIAVHVKNITGGQYFDMGFASIGAAGK